jgi:acetylornithine deacetylase/succinyl-diaminopimelate desuccinylase-like protein
MQLQQLERQFEEGKAGFIAAWEQLLRFESVSTDPAYDRNCVECAEWLVERLTKLGLSAKLLPTSGKPVVCGEFRGEPGRPTVVFYGHYDVQPVDPIDQWTSPPFSPTWRDGRLYARGAEDNKGQVSYVLAALETLLRNNELGCTFRILLEGEEEAGSAGIADATPAWRDLLQGDVLMVCDTSAAPSGAPAIIMGLRGMAGLTVRLTGASYDLHSGVHGGAVVNPAQALSALVATLHDSNGRIAIKGFYDKVRKASAEEIKLAEAGSVAESAYEALIGTPALGGEHGLPLAERVGFRPTVEVNGIHSGYGGAGSKTIIPSTAFAKITMRLVPNQDPPEALQQICEHLKTHAPRGLKLALEEQFAGGAAITVDPKSPWIQLASTVLKSTSSQPVVYHWEGASIPIVALLSQTGGTTPVMVGFGSEEDRIHAPNESFSLEQFRRGYIWVGLFLAALSKKP